MYRILIFAALMVGVMAGLWTMTGSAPLAAQTTNRSFDPVTVAPGGEVVVTIAVANYGGFGRVGETLPAGFTYVSSSLSDAQVRVSGGERQFTLQGETSFTYTVTASNTPGEHTFVGTLTDSSAQAHPLTGASIVTVSAGDGTQPTPVATAEPDALVWQDLDNLNPESQTVFSAGRGQRPDIHGRGWRH